MNSMFGCTEYYIELKSCDLLCTYLSMNDTGISDIHKAFDGDSILVKRKSIL